MGVHCSEFCVTCENFMCGEKCISQNWASDTILDKDPRGRSSAPNGGMVSDKEVFTDIIFCDFNAHSNCTSSSVLLLHARAQEEEEPEGGRAELSALSIDLEASSLITSNSTSCNLSDESVSQFCGNDRYWYRSARGGALIMDLCTMRVPPHRTHARCKYIPESHCHSISRYWGVCTISV